MWYGTRAVRTFFRGVRTGDQRLILVGAALIAFGYLRKSSPSQLVYKQRLKPGDVVRIGFEPQDR